MGLNVKNMRKSFHILVGVGFLFWLLSGISFIYGEQGFDKEKGLVGYWSFNEGSGNILKDSTPNGHNGKIHNAEWSKGRTGYALWFNGTDSYVDCGEFVIEKNLTLEVWCNSDRNYRIYNRIVGLIDTNPWATGAARIALPGAGNLEVNIPGNPTAYWRMEENWSGKWKHLVRTCQWDGTISTTKMYVDGILVGTSVGNVYAKGIKLYIGVANPMPDGYGNYFKGLMDEVAIYNRALSEEEIQQHYQKGKIEEITKKVSVKKTSELSVGLDFSQKEQEIAKTQIYLSNKPVNFSFRVENKSQEDRKCTVSYNITDINSKSLLQKSFDLEVPASSTACKELSYLPPKNGVFDLRYVLMENGEKTEKEGYTSFSVIPPMNPDLWAKDSPFGQCAGVDPGRIKAGNEAYVKFDWTGTMRLGGVKWWRLAHDWDNVEPEKGKFVWELLDRIVNDACDKGVKIMYILSYSAPWASIAPPERYCPPRLDEWKNWVTTLVSRYKDKIKCWEIWNEPNAQEALFKGGGPEEYFEVLKTAYLAIKAVDPEAKVIAPALSTAMRLGYNEPDFGYFEKLFKLGALKYLDAVSDHPYPWYLFSSPEKHQLLPKLKKLKELIDRYSEGRNIPIWLTEFAWVATDWADPDAEAMLKEGMIISERQQAAYLVRMYVQALSIGYVEKFFWFPFWHPMPNLSDLGAGHALLRYNLTARPIFVANRVLHDFLSGAEPISSKEEGSFYLYSFKRDNQYITVLWDTTGPRSARFNTKGIQAELIDLMYNSQKLASSDNIIVSFDDMPILILSDKEINFLGKID